MHIPKALLLTTCCLLSCAIAHGYSGDVWQDAALYRDEWGVPHIYADTPFAMAFVFGYAQAEDHAEHMLLAYRMANGRLAAVLGESQADSDAFSLKMGHAQLAQSALAVADPITRDLCEGFAAGVNAWLVDHADSIPDWADGVQPQDILALWHAFLMSMAPMDIPGMYHRTPAMPTSNAWAMSPDRSQEGHAALVINPHQQHDGFFQWYEAHLVLDDMNIYGATLRGLPVILQGHNETLGWALTPNQSNFADVFIEEFEETPRNPKDPRFSGNEATDNQTLLLHYMSNSLPYHVRTEAGLETRYVPVHIGDRGPIFEDAEHGLNSWTIGGYLDFGGLLQLVEMARAPSLDLFWNALCMHQMPCFNVVYADKGGNIFYLYNTKSGMRIAPPSGGSAEDSEFYSLTWDRPVSHTLAAIAWSQVFPPQQLPALLNPDSGYIQACGNPPWTASESDNLDPALWPAWLVQDADSYRAKRARQLLRQGKRSFRDHQSMLFDVVTPVALDLLPALDQAINANPNWVQQAHPDFQGACEILHQWNFVAELNAGGMTLFHLWWTFLRTRAAQEYPEEADFYSALEQRTPAVQEMLLRSVEDAARTLRNEYGALDVPWGDVHRIKRGVREAPIFGAASGDPLFIASDGVFDQGRWLATYGYGFAMAVLFGDIPESVSLLPFGTSLVPDSPHYADQLDLMLQRRFKRVRFAHDDILRNAARASGKRIVLLPLGVTGGITLNAPGIIHARLRTEIEAPEALPRNMIPFSLYMAPERSPEDLPVQSDISIHVPEELCAAADFPRLQLFRYEPGLSWQPLPSQQSDPASRIIHARDDVCAQWYVALGPADAANDAAAVLNASTQATPTIPDGPVGLDVLLKDHQPQPALTDESKRTFRFERHDLTAPAPVGDASETQSENAPGRVFRLERHDQIEEDGAEPKNDAFLQNIPGMHFGPAARDRREEEQQPGRTFRIERHDQPKSTSGAEPLTTSAPTTDTANANAIPEPQDQTQPATSVQAGDPSTSAPATKTETSEPSSESASTPEPIPSAPQASTPTTEPTLQEEVEKQRERPPLPSVIPQDPGFIFGPDKTNSPPTTSREGEEKRVFKMERL